MYLGKLVEQAQTEKPLLEEVAAGHGVACHLVHRHRESAQFLDLAGEPA